MNSCSSSVMVNSVFSSGLKNDASFSSTDFLIPPTISRSRISVTWFMTSVLYTGKVIDPRSILRADLICSPRAFPKSDHDLRLSSMRPFTVSSSFFSIMVSILPDSTRLAMADSTAFCMSILLPLLGLAQMGLSFMLRQQRLGAITFLPSSQGTHRTTTCPRPASRIGCRPRAFGDPRSGRGSSRGTSGGSSGANASAARRECCFLGSRYLLPNGFPCDALAADGLPLLQLLPTNRMTDHGAGVEREDGPVVANAFGDVDDLGDRVALELADGMVAGLRRLGSYGRRSDRPKDVALEVDVTHSDGPSEAVQRCAKSRESLDSRDDIRAQATDPADLCPSLRQRRVVGRVAHQDVRLFPKEPDALLDCKYVGFTHEILLSLSPSLGVRGSNSEPPPDRKLHSGLYGLELGSFKGLAIAQFRLREEEARADLRRLSPRPNCTTNRGNENLAGVGVKILGPSRLARLSPFDFHTLSFSESSPSRRTRRMQREGGAAG